VVGGCTAGTLAVTRPWWQWAAIARRAHGPRPIVLRHFAFFPSVAIDATSNPKAVKTILQGFPTEKYAKLAESHYGNIDASSVVTVMDDLYRREDRVRSGPVESLPVLRHGFL
jgi:hypothetical protein